MTRNLIYIILVILVLINIGCLNKEETQNKETIEQQKEDIKQINSNKNDTIIISQKHKPNMIACDLDGDNLSDTVRIVQNSKNKKYGLKIIYGNKKVDYLGMGIATANLGIDDLEWVGIFEVAPKNEIYYNNVDDEGTILTEDEVKESDKIKLSNDGIFIHQAESCGGGVIYLKNGKYEWIQQE